jgi:hypothetical protein
MGRILLSSSPERLFTSTALAVVGPIMAVTEASALRKPIPLNNGLQAWLRRQGIAAAPVKFRLLC